MSNIKIGDGNKIKSSIIGHNHNNNSNSSPSKPNFLTNHPVLTGIFASVIASIIMLFSFWKDLVYWIENLFK
ncbi:hypothetical protein [Fictibacillus sp. KU28468]|uniref:hypothetical protein n=1 Tax=Fictibacillus sp. KU28468 TaxID=2991053 RepID=UPI00223C8DAD|nr:hypothetical protein [Fictibacillus sp. KU28468]UZJ78760.1 hypothetical protein OKX00_22055 [Fictibacillus sp. KU28468]